jgi:hypothetical protein
MEATARLRRRLATQVVHARIAMLAAVGWVVQERWHPLLGGDIEGASVWLAENPLRLLVVDHGLAWRCAGAAVSHFQQVPAPFWQLLTLAVGVAEAARARKGWEEPTVAQSWFKLRRSYTPGAWLRRCCAPAGSSANGIGFIWFAVAALRCQVTSASTRCAFSRWRRRRRRTCAHASSTTAASVRRIGA